MHRPRSDLQRAIAQAAQSELLRKYGEAYLTAMVNRMQKVKAERISEEIKRREGGD